MKKRVTLSDVKKLKKDDIIQPGASKIPVDKIEKANDKIRGDARK